MQPGAPRRETFEPVTPGVRRRHLYPVAAPDARTYLADPYTVIELHGELDIVGAEVVRPRLDEVTAPPAPAVVVDLRPLLFLDCSGLGLLCRAARRVRERGGVLRLVCDDPMALRMLAVGGLLEVFRPVATLAQAVRQE